jgi:hypothetical protein
MNKAISPNSELGAVGVNLPIEPKIFVKSATGSPPAVPTTAVQIASAPVSGAADAKPKPAYPAPAELPTQQGPEGLRFDFNDGARVFCPQDEQHPWRIRLRDLDTGNVLFETEFAGGRVNSSKLREIWHRSYPAGPDGLEP